MRMKDAHCVLEAAEVDGDGALVAAGAGGLHGDVGDRRDHHEGGEVEQEGHHEQVPQPRQVLHLSLVDSAEQRARAEAVIDCMRLLMSLCSGLLYYPHGSRRGCEPSTNNQARRAQCLLTSNGVGLTSHHINTFTVP